MDMNKESVLLSPFFQSILYIWILNCFSSEQWIQLEMATGKPQLTCKILEHLGGVLSEAEQHKTCHNESSQWFI